MTDPYKVLNCPRNATDEQVKQIYRKLARKYHPDRYHNSALAKEADEKMKEINEAYSEIMKDRRNSVNAVYDEENVGYAVWTDDIGNYADIEKMIDQGSFEEAENCLKNVLPSDRKGEWYYCSALMSYRRGWLEEAYNFIETACGMDRNNAKFLRLYKTVNEGRSGTGFTNSGSRHSELSGDSCVDCLSLGECCCDAGECISGL